MKVTKVIVTTNNIAERNSADLIQFYEQHPEGLELEIKEQETEDGMIDVELYGYSEELEENQSDEATLLDKIGIPYDKDTSI